MVNSNQAGERRLKTRITAVHRVVVPVALSRVAQISLTERNTARAYLTLLDLLTSEKIVLQLLFKALRAFDHVEAQRRGRCTAAHVP
jgi:hypothetical protein